MQGMGWDADVGEPGLQMDGLELAVGVGGGGDAKATVPPGRTFAVCMSDDRKRRQNETRMAGPGSTRGLSTKRSAGYTGGLRNSNVREVWSAVIRTVANC